MWWIIGTGILFCAFQFQWLSPALGVGVKIGIGLGFLVAYWMVRKAILWKATEDDRNTSLRILEEYKKKFKVSNAMREIVSGFGSGFGESYSQVASENGDIVQSIIGEGIGLAARTLTELGKTKNQIRYEKEMQILCDRIDNKEKQATWSLVFQIFSVSGIVWMSIQGLMPIR